MRECATYKFYDSKGRRLAIFGREIEGENMEVFILTCSLWDQFSKQYAREVWENYKNTNIQYIYDCDLHPEIVIIPSGDKPNWSFNNFCKTNFKKIQTAYVTIQTEIKFLA